MKNVKNNETIRIILLAKLKDSLRSRTWKYFLHRNVNFSVCTDSYELFEQLEYGTKSLLTLLIARPAAISRQISEHLQHYQSHLCLISWLDSEENPTDTAFGFASDLSTMMFNRFDQLGNLLKILSRIIRKDTDTACLTGESPLSSRSLRALLRDDELNALLGAI